MPFENVDKSTLRFRLIAENFSPVKSAGGLFSIMDRTNSTEWMGKEPRSCRIVHFEQVKPVAMRRGSPMPAVEFVIHVGYRPDGWISNVLHEGKQRNNGWDIERLNETADGVLLDEDGGPLRDDREPVYRKFAAHLSDDFNRIDFGTLEGEDEYDG